MQTAVEAVERMFRAIETGDVSDAAAYISDDYLNREAMDDGRCDELGVGEFLENTAWLRATFSELRFETVDAIAVDDRVVMVTYMCGRQTSPFMGMPATNRMFRQRQVHLFRVNCDGKVREHLAQRDDMGLRRQLLGCDA